jgi:PAS domain S-box-containing protein
MRLSTRLMLVMVALVVLTAAAVSTLIHRNIEEHALPRALDRLDTRAHLLTLQLEAAVASARADVSVQGQAIEGVVRARIADDVDPVTGTPSDVFKKRIASRFVAELSAKPEYSQFRIIGIADGGRELVRVDRMGPGGAIRTVPESELQRKGDRDYFKAAIQLPAGQLYASPIDFNQEDGGFEKPYVPTLRVAAPIVAANGDKFGILIVNVDMRPAFDQIRNAGREGDLYVVNEQGDYLVHPDIRREFGFEFGTPFRVQDDFPEFGALLGDNDSAPRLIKDLAGNAFGIGWNTVALAGGPRITVVEAVPSAKLLASSTAWPSILGALVVALAALPVVFFLARSLSRPLVQMTRAVEAFARGITVPSPVNADGEIGVLARSFTRMADQMRTQTATLTREIEDRRRIFNTSLDLIVVLDEQDNFVQVSPSSRGILDYAPEELIGRNLASFVHTQDIDALRAEMRVSRHKPTRNFETRFVHKNGALIALTWNGTWSEGTREHFLIGRDMTEAKAVQEALLDSERIAEGIIAHSLDAIIQLNEWGEVIEWNPQAETMLGWTRKEAVGQPISDLYLPSGYAPRYVAMNEQLRRQQPIIGVRFEFDARCKDGRTIKVEVSMTGVRSRDGNVFNLFLRDITQKRAAEEQLRQAQKMEAVGQLTGGIAHDFNNMLTVITGTIDILADAVADKPELASIARLIGEAADRGAELTSHLLAFARKQPLQPRDTDVNTLVWNSAKLLRPALGEKVEIELRLSEDVWPALVDANQLVTALLNLSVNARDAMPGGGKLTLESRNVVLDEAYCQSNGDVRPGNYVMIAVSDTGHGIPKSLLDKIFEPFFSTKDVGKGTGLGLSMVYGFVKQSGGHIKAYSEEGHGTTIRMYLPQAGAEPVEAGATDAAAGMQSGSETILVVEDDAMVRTSVITQLQSLGYQTISAGSGEEALAIEESGEPFDLLFTDVILSKSMNGRHLAVEIERRRPGTKVLFTSGYTENAIIHHGRLDPGVLLLAKPYRKSELARMLRIALGGEVDGEAPPAAAPSARARMGA